MKYFWMLFNRGDQESFVGDVVDLKGIADYKLCLGEVINRWNESATVTVGAHGQRGRPDDVLQTGIAAPIFSDRLQQTLADSGIDGIQYLPIQVEGVQSRYYVANVLTRLAVLDEGASTLSRYDADYFIEDRRGKISGLRIPVLKRSGELASAHIFRLAEYWAPVFVSERFRDIFRLGKFTGVQFDEVLVTEN